MNRSHFHCMAICVAFVFRIPAVDAAWSVSDVAGSGDQVELTLQTHDADRGAMKDTAVVEPGQPDLPVIVYVLPGRRGMQAVVLSVKASQTNETDVEILPRPVETVETVNDNEVKRVVRRDANTAIYARDAFWPPSQAAVDEAFMGTNKLVRVTAYPWQYDPIRHRVRHSGELRIRLKFVPNE